MGGRAGSALLVGGSRPRSVRRRQCEDRRSVATPARRGACRNPVRGAAPDDSQEQVHGYLSSAGCIREGCRWEEFCGSAVGVSSGSREPVCSPEQYAQGLAPMRSVAKGPERLPAAGTGTVVAAFADRNSRDSEAMLHEVWGGRSAPKVASLRSGVTRQEGRVFSRQKKQCMRGRFPWLLGAHLLISWMAWRAFLIQTPGPFVLEAGLAALAINIAVYLGVRRNRRPVGAEFAAAK